MVYRTPSDDGERRRRHRRRKVLTTTRFSRSRCRLSSSSSLSSSRLAVVTCRRHRRHRRVDIVHNTSASLILCSSWHVSVRDFGMCGNCNRVRVLERGMCGNCNRVGLLERVPNWRTRIVAGNMTKFNSHKINVEVDPYQHRLPPPTVGVF